MNLINNTAKLALSAIASLALVTEINADAPAEGLYGLGVQLGFAEHASFTGAEKSLVVGAMESALEHAKLAPCVPDAEVARLLERVRASATTKAVYPEIRDFRIRMTRHILNNCSCGGHSAGAHTVPGSAEQLPFSTFRGRWHLSGYGRAMVIEVEGNKIIGEDPGVKGKFSGTIARQPDGKLRASVFNQNQFGPGSFVVEIDSRDPDTFSGTWKIDNSGQTGALTGIREK